MEITNVQGKPGFYTFKIDGSSSQLVLNTSEMIGRVRQEKAKLRSDKLKLSERFASRIEVGEFQKTGG